MPRYTIEEIKQQKFFYRNLFRRMVTLLLVSLTVTFLLIVGIVYTYSNMPEVAFYSTSGVSAPINLTPLDEPNQSSVPLLADDPPDDMAKEFGIR